MIKAAHVGKKKFCQVWRKNKVLPICFTPERPSYREAIKPQMSWVQSVLCQIKAKMHTFFTCLLLSKCITRFIYICSHLAFGACKYNVSKLSPLKIIVFLFLFYSVLRLYSHTVFAGEKPTVLFSYKKYMPTFSCS